MIYLLCFKDIFANLFVVCLFFLNVYADCCSLITNDFILGTDTIKSYFTHILTALSITAILYILEHIGK